MDDLTVQLTAKLDSGKALYDLKKLEQQLNAKGVRLKVVLDTADTLKKVIKAGKEMGKAVYDVDTAMTNLYKVTDETDYKYNQFFTSAKKNAQDLGCSLSKLVDQTATWSGLGFSLDKAKELAKVSSIYTNISNVNDETAVSDLVTTMKAFNIEASDSISIIDKLNDLGSKYAVSSADLGAELSKTGSALHIGGNSIDESLALITALTEITHDASESGNALKTLSMKLRGYDEETQRYSDDMGEFAAKIADLTKTASTPGGISLFTGDTKDTYKSTYQMLSELSKIWNNLEDHKQAELLETLTGNPNNDSISALLTNMSQADKALSDSIHSSGSAYEAQERWLESLDAKTQQFEAAFQSLSNTVVDSNLLKWFVDLGTGAVSALDTVIDKTGILLPILSGTSIAAFVKNLDHQKVLKIA